jgi:uncharacterized protein (TIGR03435 family)
VKHPLCRSILHRLLFALSFAVFAACNYLPAEARSDQKMNAPSRQSNRTAKDFEFEVVSIHPVDPERGSTGVALTRDGCRLAMSLYDLIKLGYSPDDGPPDLGKVADSTNVINAPNWGYYQIDARIADGDMPAWQAQGKSQELLRSAMRSVLKDRFRLVLREQQTKIPVYNLVVSSKGIRFKPSVPGAVPPIGYRFPDGGIYSFSQGMQQQYHFYNATITDLIWLMNKQLDRPIHDGTDLTGHYDFGVYHLGDVEDIGLDLKPGTGPGLNLIVDHIEKPSPN